jgi:hypothetical protein
MLVPPEQTYVSSTPALEANGSHTFLAYEKERARLPWTVRDAMLGRLASHACHTDALMRVTLVMRLDVAGVEGPT